MESFKIDHFRKDNPGKDFPWHRSLTSSQTEKVCRRLADTLQVFPKKNIDIVNAIYAYSQVLEDTNADKDGFSLSKLFESIKISPAEKVYINWYQFDNIDEVRFIDLCNYFEDIWYPGPDDIDIFDSSLQWILSVTHDGMIRFAKF